MKIQNRIVKWALINLLLWNSALAVAEQPAWMKQSSPNNLGLFVDLASACSFDKSELRTKLEDEFLRARVKPDESIDFYLNVNVICMPIESASAHLHIGEVVSYSIRYGTTTAKHELMLFLTRDYGTMVTGGKEDKGFLINNINDGLADALTDYLKANFP